MQSGVKVKRFVAVFDRLPLQRNQYKVKVEDNSKSKLILRWDVFIVLRNVDVTFIVEDLFSEQSITLTDKEIKHTGNVAYIEFDRDITNSLIRGHIIQAIWLVFFGGKTNLFIFARKIIK